MKILSESTRNHRKGPEAWFTGNVWIDDILVPDFPARLRSFRVTFAPKARTAWHTHPAGQTLHVLSGIGLIQLKGQPIQQIKAGDSVWIEPNEVHWHGAVPGQTLIHLAIQEADDQGIDVVWLNLVSDEEYTQTA